jgi:hypothetical protein
MTVAWPAGVPALIVRRAYGAQAPDMTDGEQTTSGLDKVRQVRTAAPETITGQWRWTTAQKATFDTWWRTTAKGGAEEVDYPDPLAANALRRAQIVPGSLRAAMRTNGTWVVDFQMRIWR